jgi:putative peptidoglycan lipid II flippase
MATAKVVPLNVELVHGLNGRVASAAVSLTAAAVVVKIVATLKEFAVAGTYGRSAAMDAFLVAFLVPNLLINLIAESMNQALVPTLIRVRIEQGKVRAQELLSSSMLSLCILLTAAMLITGVVARGIFPLLGSGFGAGKLDLTLHLFYGLLPVVLLSGIASSCTAVLNSVGKFALPAVAPMVMPVSVMAGALLLHGRFGIWGLVDATILGSLLHASIVAGMMNRRAYRFRLQWAGKTAATREVIRQYGPVLLSSVVASGGLIADQGLAAMLPVGSVSALVFAGRFVSVIVSLLGGAVSSALAPHFSILVAQRDWQGCRETMRTWARLTAMVSVPLAVGLISGSHWLVQVTLQHGVFGPRDTAAVATVMGMYAIQIPFFAVSRVYYRFVIAMRRSDLVFYCGGANLILDIALDLLLMRWIGVAGIALATSIWCMSTLVFLWYAARHLLSEVSRDPGPGDPEWDGLRGATCQVARETTSGTNE